MFGLCISPGSLPPTSETAELGVPYYRSILYSVRQCETLAQYGVPYMVTVNNECAEVRGWQNWEGAIAMIANQPRPPFAVCVGNEFDLFWEKNRADVPPEFAASLVRQAAKILRPQGIKVVATSVASGVWPEYLRWMADLCRDDADWFDIHPYGQRPDNWGYPGWMHGDLADTLGLARSLAGKPTICSEIGVKVGDTGSKVGDAGSEEQVASWMLAAAKTLQALGRDVCPYAAWFAWHDRVGAPYERGLQAFGLRRDDTDNSKRPAYYAYAALPRTSGGPLPMFTVGQGVLDRMNEFGDEPATDEIYHPIGAQAGKHQYSETFGASGRRYVYIFAVNRTVIYEPQG